MDETPRTLSQESAADPGKWIVRVVIAVILAEAIWGFIVSITNSLVLPLLARTMGGDVQSPLYLGKGDINVPGLFTAILELCFAGIVAVVANSFLQRKPRMTRTKPVRVSPIPAPTTAPPLATQPIPPVQRAVSASPIVTAPVPAPPPEPAATSLTTAPLPSPGQFWSPPEPLPVPKATAPAPAKPTAKPAKPKPPKEIYYNIVGEPINPTEDD